MTQTIIVYAIIVLAIVYSAYAVLKNVRKKETSPCGDCNGCDIKKEITKNLKYALSHEKSCASKSPDTCGCSPK